MKVGMQMKRLLNRVGLIGFTILLSFITSQAQKFVIYGEGIENGVPSGIMGANDGKSLRIIGNYDEGAYEGQYCMKVKCDGSENWTGFYIQAAGRWRAQVDDINAFAKLKGYNYFEFWAKADRNVNIQVGFGEGDDDSFADANVSLTKQWKKFRYYVGDVDLETLNGLFSVVLNQAATVYFDNIIFEKYDKRNPTANVSSPITTEKKWFSAPPTPSKVTYERRNGNYVLLKDGQPYYVNGAGGQIHLDRVKAYGGNSIRTWSDDNAGAILDSAYKHGLTVMLGLWLGHERHGFDYDDKEAVKYQTLRFKETVKRYKDHPALLLWGIGNELDLFYKNTNVWYAVQDVAKMIHELDPNHPTSTVTAGMDTTETRLIKERCPDIDIYGVNTYGDIAGVAQKMRDARWDKPYMVTEWGPTGHWEITKTEFNVPIEQTSKEKALVYKERYGIIKSDSQLCVGSYVFLWGDKQETTPTWYGLFLSNGAETQVMDAIEEAWSGKSPVNKAPILEKLLVDGKVSIQNIYLKRDKTYTAKAEIVEPEGEKLKYDWVILPESTTTKAGGDWEEKPAALPELIQKVDGNVLTFSSPLQPGPYRLFVYAYDEHNNAAVANTVFYVKE